MWGPYNVWDNNCYNPCIKSHVCTPVSNVQVRRHSMSCATMHCNALQCLRLPFQFIQWVQNKIDWSEGNIYSLNLWPNFGLQQCQKNSMNLVWERILVEKLFKVLRWFLTALAWGWCSQCPSQRAGCSRRWALSTSPQGGRHPVGCTGPESRACWSRRYTYKERQG